MSMTTGVPQTRSSQQRVRKPAAKAQPAQPTTLPASEETAQPTPEPTPPETEAEKANVEADLVTIPVIATSAQGNYIPDLRQEEFIISEDGARQQIASLATVSAPFHVVLVLDTSADTEEKLEAIHRAAEGFVDRLQPADRVKVISFNDEVRDLNDFTNDRSALKQAIDQSGSGAGTRLYDAFDMALAAIRPIRGRKAIVLFTDGVDWHSDLATYEGSLYSLDQDDVIVYPIRFETRAEAERIARTSSNEPSLPTIDVVRAPGTTPSTFPSDDPNSVPNSDQRRTGPLGLPSASEILRGRRNPNQDPLPAPDRLPPTAPTGRPEHDPAEVGGRPGSTTPPPSSGNRRSNDSIGLMLDNLYLKADTFLLELASHSGGRVLRADTLGSLPDAFAKVAAEMKTQYAISYYPINKTHDGQYRKVKVTSTRSDAIIRARPGYRTSLDPQ
jgi:von Willebrand factor type A domain-containing protein